jgi:hypothetical protein
MKIARIAGWLLTLGGASLAPPAASAQEVSDTTPPGVAVTSPRSGAVVPTGLVIRATASDDVAVASVRFFADGVEIATQGTPTAQSAVWDTTPIAEGAHTLTAVARDTAGNTASIDIPVTVDRTPPVVSLTSPVSGGTVAGLVNISADVVDAFGADRVWFTVNDVLVAEDRTAPYAAAWDTLLLPDGLYRLKAAVEDKAGGLSSTEVVVTLANGTTRIEEGDPALTYSGTWSHGNSGLRPWAGGTASFNTLTQSLAQATLQFSGTGVTWIGFRGPQAGLANVYLDGLQVATVDLYDPVERVKSVVYSVNGLAAGSHTLIVEATGTWNPSSSDPFVVVDAFIVNGW